MRVLVVEDSSRLAEVIAEGLRGHGMAVDVAYAGEDAMTKLGVNAYQVVVLGRHLPDPRGEALCRQTVEVKDRAMVLMFSAAGEPEDRVAGLRLGVDDYLARPVHFAELVLRKRALARRQPSAQRCVIRASGIELQTTRHVASRDGRDLDLSGKELSVLEVLTRTTSATPALS